MYHKFTLVCRVRAPILYVAGVLLFVTLAIVGLSSNAWASALDKVTHYTLHYPPYWIAKGQEVSGYHYELSQALYKKAGLEVHYVVMPYARIAAIKEQADTQVISYGSASPGSDSLLFPMPATIISLSSYALSSKPPSKLADYYLSAVALKRGFPLGPFSEILTNKNIDAVELGTVNAAIQLLIYNRVDYVITLQDPFEAALEKFKPLKQPILETKLVRIYGHPIAINKANPLATELHKRLTNAYIQLEAQGVVLHKREQTLLTRDYDQLIKE